MIIKNEAALQECRTIGFCEICGETQNLQAAHVLARGMGGGKRLDIPLCLICLCGSCHRAFDEGQPNHKGEKVTFEQVAAAVLSREIWKIQRADKNTPVEKIAGRLSSSVFL